MRYAKYYIVSLLAVMACLELRAVPAAPTPFDALTTDGQTVSVTMHGDEYYHWYEDADGALMVCENGRFRHAGQHEREEMRQRRVQARRIASQQTASDDAFPKTGTVRVVVLLAEYADKQFVTAEPAARFSRLFNEGHYADNGATGSVHDYYIASSQGQLDLQFDVFGPYRLSHEEAYYGGNTNTSSNKNAQALVTEVVKLADADGVDFSVYDNTHSGNVDNVSVITAGHNEAEGGPANSIWPHQSSIWNPTYVDGKMLTTYLMTSELRGKSGSNMSNIGTYCHEFGHVLGLPDLYNTEKKDAYTVGTWDIMCSGSYNNTSRTPPVFSAFEQFYMGWLQPQQLTSPQHVTMGPLTQEHSAYLIASGTHNLKPSKPTPSEYFLIENRQRHGWDSVSNGLPGTGLLISHITYSSTGWETNTFNNYSPLGYDIEEAYQSNPTSSMPSDAYPGSAYVTRFTPRLNNDTWLEQYGLTNILQRTDGSISFTFGHVSNPPLALDPAVPDTLFTTFGTRVEEYRTQRIRVTGTGLAGKTLRISTDGRFHLSLDGTNWTTMSGQLTDSVSQDGNYDREIHVRYYPSRQTCTASLGQLVVMTDDSSAYANASLLGIAPRPVYIQTPDSVYVDSRTSSSFRVRWSDVEDAEYYYITLYDIHVSGSDTTYTEHERHAEAAPNTSTQFNGLMAGYRYKVQVQAAEEKSCSEHVTAPAEIIDGPIVERQGNRIMPVLLEDGTYVLWICEPIEVPTTMAIYKEDGRLYYTQTVEAGTFNPRIPVEKMQRGELYLIKLYSDHLKRSDLWTKFIYY